MGSRPALVAGFTLLATIGCSEKVADPVESFFPRHLAVEVDPAGVHFLHVAGFADGSLRIYRVGDESLALQRAFWSGVGVDPGTGEDGVAIVRSELFVGAWEVLMTSDQTSVLVSGRLAHGVARLVKDAGTWVIGGDAREGAEIPLDIPPGGGGTDLLAGNRIPGLSRPQGIALSPDESAFYVGGSGDNAIARFGFDGAALAYEDSTLSIPAPRQLVALSPATGSSSATGGLDEVLYVLGGRSTSCLEDDTSLLGLRWTDTDTFLEQRILSGPVEISCVGAEDPQDCLRDTVDHPGLIGGWDLTWTQTASGAEYLLVSSECNGTVTALERRDDDLLQVAGAYRVIAPWETAMTTAEDGTVTTLTATSASSAGFRDVVVFNDMVYVAAGDGGFISFFPLTCLTSFATLEDPTVCEGILCLDETNMCALDPKSTPPRSISAHPWGMAIADSVLYVTLDLEGKIAVIDLDPAGAPTLRYIGE